MVGCAIRLKNKKPEWLSELLGSKFFRRCLDHQDIRKNEKNVFCIDCSLCLCRHCLTSSSSHRLHSWLQIWRYCYHDVVHIQDVRKHLDCSKIQTYKINGEKAVHLNPRPQSKDSKASTKLKGGASCEACGRIIQDLPNRFCSIACKFSVISEKYEEKSNETMSSSPISEVSDVSLKEDSNSVVNMNKNESALFLAELWEGAQASVVSSSLRPKGRLCKRKGIPRKSPFC